ncbi:MAG: acyclic terpene utilization AtuA family protein [Alistipes sp.]|nr:acyclic terpene utilization AtuA family protein [Alistipes sp.]
MSNETKKEIRVLSPTAILGYGFPEESFNEGMRRNPDVIAVDAGSTDPGPYYLGAGYSFTDRNAVKRDLSIMIPAALKAGIPVMIGTAGGSGARPHVEETVGIIKEIVEEQKLHFKMAVIQSEFEKDFVKEKIRKGDIFPLGPVAELTEKDVDESIHIVAQMGEEPFIKAYESGAQVILAGRSYDPCEFSSLAISRGFDKALAIHMGKVLECAAITALPGSGSDCMLGTLKEDSFVVEPLNPIRKCTALSVAAHSLYEKSNPYVLPGPGGALDLNETKFTQLSDTQVEVRGTKFVPTEEYFVKLEGVRRVGYRTMSPAATHDPIMISQIDTVVEKVRERVMDNFRNSGMKDFHLDFKIYGKKGVMNMFPKTADSASDELLIIIEAVAQTQEEANTICGFARSTMLHYGYEGRISTAGNLAFPFSPSDCKMGAVYEFNVYHLMRIEDTCAPFPITYMEF